MYQQTFTQNQLDSIPTISFIQPETSSNINRTQLDGNLLEMQHKNLELQQQLQSLQNAYNALKHKEPFTFTEEDVKALPQLCSGTNNKKTILSILIAIVILFFVSTYTVSAIDRWLDNHQVDLFSQTDRMNELLLFIIQFLFIFTVVRFILNFL